MWVSFQIPAKSMQDKDKSRRVVHRFVPFMKQAQDDAVGSMKQAVQEGAVRKEKFPQAFHILGSMASPNAGSPQLIIFSIFSISQSRGWRIYFISS